MNRMAVKNLETTGKSVWKVTPLHAIPDKLGGGISPDDRIPHKAVYHYKYRQTLSVPKRLLYYIFVSEVHGHGWTDRPSQEKS